MRNIKLSAHSFGITILQIFYVVCLENNLMFNVYESRSNQLPLVASYATYLIQQIFTIR